MLVLVGVGRLLFAWVAVGAGLMVIGRLAEGATEKRRPLGTVHREFAP